MITHPYGVGRVPDGWSVVSIGELAKTGVPQSNRMSISRRGIPQALGDEF